MTDSPPETGRNSPNPGSGAGTGPLLTDAGLAPTWQVAAMDEYGEPREIQIAGERPLTVYLDRREIVTLMTLGGHPEALVLGYLRNQGLVTHVEDIKAVQVDWDVDAASVTTYGGNAGDNDMLETRTVTTGCGQGTVYGDLMEKIDDVVLPRPALDQSLLYALLGNIASHNEVYKRAGAVHGCALCDKEQIVYFVEDVGRHNAVDAIAGQMWLDGVDGGDKIFYTTGRLTSEMVIKVAQIGVPILLSRSGVTKMGFELAERLGVLMIARAKGKHFLSLTGADRLSLDAIPPARRNPAAARTS